MYVCIGYRLAVEPEAVSNRPSQNTAPEACESSVICKISDDGSQKKSDLVASRLRVAASRSPSHH